MDLGIGAVIGIAAAGILSLPLLVGGVFVIIVVANRADPDPSGRRPAVVYAAAVSFISLFATLFATYAVVAKLCSLIGPHAHSLTSSLDDGSDSPFPPSFTSPGVPAHPVGDAVARGVVLGLLIVIVAGAAYLLHARAASAAADGQLEGSPVVRVRSSYLAAVCFVCVLIAVTASVAGVYELFRVLAPGVFSSSGTGSRQVALRVMLPLIYLAAAAVGLLLWHLRQLPPGARPTLRPRPAGPADGEVVAPVVVEPPVAATVEVLDITPPPRKRAPRKPRPPAE